MSFGWSVGDIVAALQLLNKVVGALKDTGGASSEYQHVTNFLGVLTVTLQHLKALQAVPLDPDLAESLKQHCEVIQGPLTSFREWISSRFERDLGPDSTRLKVLTTGRKLQWALSTAKDVKILEGKIGGHLAAISIVLSQQVIQTTLQIPAEIQARIAHTIDTAVDIRISPLTLKVHKEVAALAAAEKASSKHIKETIQDVQKDNAAEIQKHSQNITLDLEQKFSTLSASQQPFRESLSAIQDRSQTLLEAVKTQSINIHANSETMKGQVLDLSIRQSQSTNIVLRAVRKENQRTVSALQTHASTSQHQALSLHKKLDRMIWLMGTAKDRMGNLSMVQNSAHPSASNSEIEKAIRNLQQGVWLLVSALHVLMRELIHLLAPYMFAIYRTSIQPLLLYGDHFLFEDAIGRRKWLPCLQFQHWEKFYGLLVDSFQGEAGLSRILNGQFVVLNGFNEVPIHKKMWRSGIQPKSRVHMAMILKSSAIKKGKCATPSCPGRVDFEKDETTRLCPVCGKHLLTLKDTVTDDDEFTAKASFSFDFGSEIQIPILTSPFDSPTSTKESKSPLAPVKSQPRIKAGKAIKHSLAASDNDIAAFKRVVWQDSIEQLPEQVANTPTGVKFIRRQSRRTRDIKLRQKPVSPTYDRKIEGSRVPRWAPIPPTPPIPPMSPIPPLPPVPSIPPMSLLVNHRQISPSPTLEDLPSRSGSEDRKRDLARNIIESVTRSFGSEEEDTMQQETGNLPSLNKESESDKERGCSNCIEVHSECLPLGRESSGMRCYHCITWDLTCSYMSSRNYPSSSHTGPEDGTSANDEQTDIGQRYPLPPFPSLKRTSEQIALHKLRAKLIEMGLGVYYDLLVDNGFSSWNSILHWLNLKDSDFDDPSIRNQLFWQQIPEALNSLPKKLLSPTQNTYLAGGPARGVGS